MSTVQDRISSLNNFIQKKTLFSLSGPYVQSTNGGNGGNYALAMALALVCMCLCVCVCILLHYCVIQPALAII